jgi:hypothetical protein
MDAEHSVYRGHTEQNMAVRGHITVDGLRYELNGPGYRDKSWGPRHWHNFFWYQWLPVTFDRDFGVLLSVKGTRGGANRISGNVLRDGLYEPVIDGRIETVYDELYYPKSLEAWVKTDKREYRLTGRVGALVPLRHRRKGSDDPAAYTRITEGLTEYQCEGRTALGLSEYLDEMVGGVPISLMKEAA